VEGIGLVPRHGLEVMFQLQYPTWHLKTKELGGEATINHRKNTP
jgi:hypothetical protein